MIRITAVAVALALALAAASLTVLSGGGQFAPPGTTLPTPIRVRVLDEYGNLVTGQTTQYASLLGTGAASPSSAATDAFGEAMTVWTLGPEQGAQQLAVQAGAVSTTLFANVGTPCSAGYCLSNGACCPSSAQYYCRGSCYVTYNNLLSAGCTTAVQGACF